MAAASNSCQSSLLGSFCRSLPGHLRSAPDSAVRNWTLAGLSQRPLPRIVSRSTFDLWTLTLSVVCCFPSSYNFFFLLLTHMLELCNYSCHSHITPHPHFVFALSLFLFKTESESRTEQMKEKKKTSLKVVSQFASLKVRLGKSQHLW